MNVVLVGSHQRPDAVYMDRAEPGNTAPLTMLVPCIRTLGVAAVSRNGVLGDPRGATAEEGWRLLAEMIEQALSRESP